MWTAIFVMLTVFLFLFPLLPSFIEMKYATDAKPLEVVQKYDIEIRHFAFGFKTWLEKNFSEFLSTQNSYALENVDGYLQDKTAYQIIGKDGAPTFTREEIYNTSTQKLILSAFPIQLKESMLFETEIYGAKDIQTAPHSQFRALLAEGDISLEEGCTVLRWIHSNCSLYAGIGCSLFGRASADEIIVLSEKCRFERLNAKKILFGPAAPHPVPPSVTLTPIASLPNVKEQFRRRWLIDGDLEIPAHCSFDGDIIASKGLRIGTGSHIGGSLKSNQDLYLADDVHIEGTIISCGSIHIGSRCSLKGPVIAEKTLKIGTGTLIGRDAFPTTIAAPTMQISSGVTAYGTVWAEESGTVLLDAMRQA